MMKRITILFILVILYNASNANQQEQEKLDIVEDFHEISERFAIVTHTLNYESDILQEYQDLATDISTREAVLKNTNLKKIQNKKNSAKRDLFMDYSNSIYRADNLLLDYAEERMKTIRSLFDYAESKIKRSINAVRPPSSADPSKYTTVSIGKTPLIEQNTLAQEFAKGFIDGYQRAGKAVKDSKWIEFSFSLFEDVSNLLTTVRPQNVSGVVSDYDEYLLAWHVVESQHNSLYSRSLNLYHKADIYENGILNSNSETTLSEKILPQKSINEMIDSVNAKLLSSNKKVGVSKHDAKKQTVPLIRYSNRDDLKISYVFSTVDSNEPLITINWNNALESLYSKMKSFKDGEKLVKMLKTYLEGFTNSEGGELLQFIGVGVNFFFSMFGLGVTIRQQIQNGQINNQIQNINNNLPLQQVPNPEEENEELDEFGNPV